MSDAIRTAQPGEMLLKRYRVALRRERSIFVIVHANGEELAFWVAVKELDAKAAVFRLDPVRRFDVDISSEPVSGTSDVPLIIDLQPRPVAFEKSCGRRA